MTLDEDIQRKLRDHEDGFTERKPKGVSTEDICKTLVAFANSLDQGQEAVLFIGVSDNGNVLGVDNTDEMEKKVGRLAKHRCYPPIPHNIRVFEELGQYVVAVIVSSSELRPHFAGPAYIRRGSESITASSELLDELIASRNTKAGAILRKKGEIVSVVKYSPLWKLNPRHRHIDIGKSIETRESECRITACDAHSVHMENVSSGAYVSEPLEKISISYDEKKRRMKLTIDDR